FTAESLPDCRYSPRQPIPNVPGRLPLPCICRLPSASSLRTPTRRMTMRFALSMLALLAAGGAQAANCTIDLKGDDMMKFDQQSVTVSSSCESITINLQHVGKLPAQTMGHNVVISPTAFYQAAAQDGMKAEIGRAHVLTPVT